LAAPGDDAALEEHVASRLSRALDLQHPPWEVHLIQGYAGGTVIYTRLHHALADGTALFRVVLSLADEEPPEEPAGDGLGLLQVARSALQALPGAGRMLKVPMVAEHLLLARRPASPLSQPPQHGKRAVWTASIDVADLAELRSATGTTVTDIVMAALAGALRRWLLVHGADPMVDDLPTMVPVDLRGSAALRAEDLGNQFALVLLDLPVGIDSALGRLEATAARMRAIKASPEAWLTYGLLEGMGFMHPRLRVLATDFFARKATGVTTSVRGPDQPLHLAGLPITRLWAWAPMSGDQSLTTSIIGYAGRIHVGFKVDAATVPDPQALVAGLHEEIAELIALAPTS
jgi:WS/DGAT/MGAT family acyltransferase